MMRIRDFAEKSFSAWTKEEDANERNTVNVVLSSQDPLKWAKENFSAYKERMLYAYDDKQGFTSFLTLIEHTILSALDTENLILTLQGLDAEPGLALDALIHWTYAAQTGLRYGVSRSSNDEEYDDEATIKYVIHFPVRYKNQIVSLFSRFHYWFYMESQVQDEYVCTFQTKDEISYVVMKEAYNKTWLNYLKAEIGR